MKDVVDDEPVITTTGGRDENLRFDDFAGSKIERRRKATTARRAEGRCPDQSEIGRVLIMNPTGFYETRPE